MRAQSLDAMRHGFAQHVGGQQPRPFSLPVQAPRILLDVGLALVGSPPQTICGS